MLDPKLLRDHTAEVANTLLAKRGFVVDVATIQTLETQRRALQTRTQELQNKRNTHSKAIGIAKAKGEDLTALLAETTTCTEQLSDLEQSLQQLQQQLRDIYLLIPNLPDPSVPSGKTEEDNIAIHYWGEPRTFDFTPQDHVALGEQLGAMNFAMAAKLTGSRFVMLQGCLARLQRALIQFMLDKHTLHHGYTEVYVPYIVNQESMIGVGQLPKFAEDIFALAGDAKYYLISTAEVPVTNLARDEIIDLARLPQKYVAHTPCFRSEAGSYGKDIRGMIRNHQFEKVELVQLVTPEMAPAAHEELTQHAESILQALELPYRRMLLCGGDLGFSSAKTYDLEVWLPGQNAYREISSCSHYTDFQARRMQARYRDPRTGKPELLHTINGSALAVGRTLIAILENCQDAQGRIHVPSALKPYLPAADAILGS